MPIHKLEELTWKQLDELPRDRTVLFVPVSPLEEHGTHLPLGVDAFSAVAFARACAEEFVSRGDGRHAVLGPLIPLGTWTFDFVGSVWIRQRIVRALVEDFGDSYARYGFRHILVTNGHGAPGHVVALEEACQRVTRRHRKSGVQMVSPLGPMIARYFGGEYARALREAMGGKMSEQDAALLPEDIHAGFYETSMTLHLRPELVGEEFRRLPPVLVPKGKLFFSTARLAGEGLGYIGYPTKADPAIGAAAIALVRQEVGDLMEAMVAGRDVSQRVKSAYSRVPYYHTDFWRCLGLTAAAAVAALGLWLW